jgi:hypothetical protein
MSKESEAGGKSSTKTAKSPDKSKSFFTDERGVAQGGLFCDGAAAQRRGVRDGL